MAKDEKKKPEAEIKPEIKPEVKPEPEAPKPEPVKREPRRVFVRKVQHDHRVYEALDPVPDDIEGLASKHWKFDDEPGIAELIAARDALPKKPEQPKPQDAPERQGKGRLVVIQKFQRDGKVFEEFDPMPENLIGVVRADLYAPEDCDAIRALKLRRGLIRKPKERSADLKSRAADQGQLGAGLVFFQKVVFNGQTFDEFAPAPEDAETMKVIGKWCKPADSMEVLELKVKRGLIKA